ncbi:MAG: hypothetical protein OCD01_05280 [Fibrobacterales bacterium]
MSINVSSKDIVALDIGLPMLYDWNRHEPFYNISTDSATGVSKNLSILNSIGLTSWDISTGFIWGKDQGKGFSYKSIYALYGINWVDFLFTEKGQIWGVGFRVSEMIFIGKIEYQRGIKNQSNLFLIEVGVGI